jgi:hypothetical protein
MAATLFLHFGNCKYANNSIINVGEQVYDTVLSSFAVVLAISCSVILMFAIGL